MVRRWKIIFPIRAIVFDVENDFSFNTAPGTSLSIFVAPWKPVFRIYISQIRLFEASSARTFRYNILSKNPGSFLAGYGGPDLLQSLRVRCFQFDVHSEIDPSPYTKMKHLVHTRTKVASFPPVGTYGIRDTVNPPYR